jgi:predicted DNA-binding transcriptional regulator AlpA
MGESTVGRPSSSIARDVCEFRLQASWNRETLRALTDTTVGDQVLAILATNPKPNWSAEEPMTTNGTTNAVEITHRGRNVERVRTAMLRVARLKDLLEHRRSAGDQADEFTVSFGIQSVGSGRSVTLSDVLADPARVKGVPRERIPVLLLQLASLETALAGRLEELTTTGADKRIDNDRLLTVSEAAETLKTSEDWLYRNATRLPFVVRMGRRQLRFSALGIARHIEQRSQK